MNYLIRLSFIPLILLILSTAFVVAEDKQDKERDKIRTMTSETLEYLYNLQPKSKEAIDKAFGYAVFSNFGMKILLAGGGKGKGLAVNNQTGKETFMKMLELQAGLGMGIKKFRVIFVIETQNSFNHFINSGWEFGGQSTAAAKLDDQGGALAGAVSVS
ncbi:MAG: hypothetical protein N2A97_05725, partial [Thermodesulfobacteriales bacterium]